MPIVNGACLPPLCVHVRWKKGNAALKYVFKKKVAPPPPVPPVLTGAMAGGIPGITSLPAFLATLVPFDQDCDVDCRCVQAKNWPWQVVPDHLLFDDNKGWQVYVTGVQVQVVVEPCFPKPAPQKSGSGSKSAPKKGAEKKNKKTVMKGVKKRSAP